MFSRVLDCLVLVLLSTQQQQQVTSFTVLRPSKQQHHLTVSTIRSSLQTKNTKWFSVWNAQNDSSSRIHSNNNNNNINNSVPPATTPAASVATSTVDDVQNAMDDPSAVVLDVRSVEEIVEKGHLQVDRQWIHAECSPQGSCPLLSVASESLIPQKSTPVIVYCGSGKRASFAKDLLERQGYLHVLNAGAFANLGYLQIYKDANI